MKSFWSPERVPVEGLCGRDNEAITEIMGQMLTTPKVTHYVEIKDWGRWVLWQEWLEKQYPDGEGVAGTELARYLKQAAISWPRANVVLLGNVSTQAEWDELFEVHLISADLEYWRKAALLTPTEDIALNLKRAPTAIQQIILEWKCPEKYCDRGHVWRGDDDWDKCECCHRFWPQFRASIISQVRQVRGECRHCKGQPSILYDRSPNETLKLDCIHCHGTGAARGQPYLWDGDEWLEVAP